MNYRRSRAWARELVVPGEYEVPLGRRQYAVFQELLASVNHPGVVFSRGTGRRNSLRLSKHHNAVWCEVA